MIEGITPAYIGRHRIDPDCQYQFEGCTGDGREILQPYVLEMENREEIVVACYSCERELSTDV